jgi:hypothetical protein
MARRSTEFCRWRMRHPPAGAVVGRLDCTWSAVRLSGPVKIVTSASAAETGAVRRRGAPRTTTARRAEQRDYHVGCRHTSHSDSSHNAA